MRKLLIALALLVPVSATAESALPFMKDMAGDRDLPRPWGIGFDFFTMDQDYRINELEFILPGVSLPDVSKVQVTNEVQHFDIKADVWLLPFLNVFGVLGHVKSDTVVDLRDTPIIGLPPGFPGLGQLPIDTDGTVWGLGATLAFGGDRWFGSLTGTWTDADLSGDFDSSAETITLQPRVGMIWNQWVGWVGGMYLDIEESHAGVIDIPGIGQLPFSAVLGQRTNWNTALGAQHHFSDKASLSLEVGFGDRKHTLFNFNYRF